MNDEAVLLLEFVAARRVLQNRPHSAVVDGSGFAGGLGVRQRGLCRDKGKRRAAVAARIKATEKGAKA